MTGQLRRVRRELAVRDLRGTSVVLAMWMVGWWAGVIARGAARSIGVAMIDFVVIWLLGLGALCAWLQSDRVRRLAAQDFDRWYARSLLRWTWWHRRAAGGEQRQ